MNPLEQKIKLREEFKRKKELESTQKKELLSFREFDIKVNVELLRIYRSERGGAIN